MSKMKKLYCVIHLKDLKTTEANLKTVVDSGAHGVFLINMDYDNKSLLVSPAKAYSIGTMKAGRLA